MKQILKKMSAVCTAFLCALTVMAASAGSVWAASAADEMLEQQAIMMAEGLTETIIPLSDEDVEAYISSGDDFTIGAMTSWNTAKKELGEKKDEQDGKTEAEVTHGQCTVTVPVAFEKADANFVYVFGEDGTPVSMTVDIQYPMSVTLQRAGLNTLMGLATVFLMLIFLSFVIYLFRFIPGLLEGKKKQAEVPAAAPAPAVAVPVVEETAADDGELIAVIAAAIAASEGTGTDGFVVRSIRKLNRKKR